MRQLINLGRGDIGLQLHILPKVHQHLEDVIIGCLGDALLQDFNVCGHSGDVWADLVEWEELLLAALRRVHVGNLAGVGRGRQVHQCHVRTHRRPVHLLNGLGLLARLNLQLDGIAQHVLANAAPISLIALRGPARGRMRLLVEAGD